MKLGRNISAINYISNFLLYIFIHGITKVHDIKILSLISY